MLVQAENDYDVDPTHAVGQQLADAKKPHTVAGEFRRDRLLF